jgi:hypothetical protein
MMKNNTIKICYDGDQLTALEMALKEKGQSLENELLNYLDQLFERSVNRHVQSFLLNRPAKPPRPPRSRPQKQSGALSD